MTRKSGDLPRTVVLFSAGVRWNRGYPLRRHGGVVVAGATLSLSRVGSWSENQEDVCVFNQWVQ